MRAYVQKTRASRARETTRRILEEAERLFAAEPFDRVTFEAVARSADVSVPTIQRRYGNKEGLIAAVVERVSERVREQRAAPPPGDVRASLRQLVDHYEAEGRMVWHLLRQEQEVPALAALLTGGRRLHREWVQEAFEVKGKDLLDALVAATDVFTWKLLRLDLGRSRKDVERVMARLVDGVLAEGTR